MLADSSTRVSKAFLDGSFKLKEEDFSTAVEKDMMPIPLAVTSPKLPAHPA